MRIAPARLCLLPVVLLALAEAGSPANSVAGAERPGSLGAYALQNATLIGTCAVTDRHPAAGGGLPPVGFGRTGTTDHRSRIPRQRQNSHRS